jgi:hypothetical protein
MAASGTYTTTIRTGYQLKLVWQVTSQNVANNTSTVSVKVQLVSTGSSYTINSSASKSGTLKINGTSYSFNFSAALSGNQTKTLFTKSVTITHNADGTKSCAFEAVAGINVTLSGTYYGNVTVSGTGTFNTIPRASKPSLSASSVQMGNSITINTNRASSAFTHVLSYSFGSLSGTIASNVGASYSWAVPLSLANAIPNNTSGSGTITCKTYNGSTLIGTASVTFKATVPSSVVPTISTVNISEAVSGIAAKFNAYVQHKSKLKVAITAAGAYSSTISKYETKIQNVAYAGNSFTSNIITASGTISIVTTVTDSRGRTASKTSNITVLAYALPKITTFNAFRCNADGTENPDGTRVKVELNFSISPVNNLNDKYYEVVYRLKGSTGSWGAIASGNIYSRNDSFISGSYFNPDNAYDLALQLYDYFGGARVDIDIPTAFTLIDLKASGKGIAFGKVAETDDLMDINFPILARKGITFEPIEAGTDLNDLTEPGFYGSASAGSANFINCPVSSGTFTLEVMDAGMEGQLYQRLTMCSKDSSITYERFYYSSAWGDWNKIKDFDGTVLWSGAWYMNASQTANLSEKVSEQPNGIVLVFSRYSSGQAQNYHWRTFFIPKYMVANHASQGFSFLMNDVTFSYMCSKYLYIHDDKIGGNDNNVSTGTANGITYANNACVLRYVIGV